MTELSLGQLIHEYILDRMPLFVARPGYDAIIANYLDERKINLYKLGNKLIDIQKKKGITSTQFYEQSLISKQTYYDLFKHQKRPKKTTIIKIVFGCRLDIDDTLELLDYSGYTLSDSSFFDLINRYFIENKIYDLEQLNHYLEKYQQEIIPLGK
jgi:hypothetical protein